jgi:hypothetical protein
MTNIFVNESAKFIFFIIILNFVIFITQHIYQKKANQFILKDYNFNGYNTEILKTPIKICPLYPKELSIDNFFHIYYFFIIYLKFFVIN